MELSFQVSDTQLDLAAGLCNLVIPTLILVNLSPSSAVAEATPDLRPLAEPTETMLAPPSLMFRGLGEGALMNASLLYCCCCCCCCCCLVDSPPWKLSLPFVVAEVAADCDCVWLGRGEGVPEGEVVPPAALPLIETGESREAEFRGRKTSAHHSNQIRRLTPSVNRKIDTSSSQPGGR
jgi:hypothetical protein